MGESTNLDHEILDDAMEHRPLIASVFIVEAVRESNKVRDRFRHDFTKEAERDATQGLPTHLNFEEHIVWMRGTAFVSRVSNSVSASQERPMRHARIYWTRYACDICFAPVTSAVSAVAARAEF